MTTDDFLYGLLGYGALPPSAHRALEAYAEAHPSLRSVHDEVAVLGPDADPGAYRDAVLAHYAATRALPQAPPEPLAALMDRLAAQIDEDPDMAFRFERLAARLATVDAASGAPGSGAALYPSFESTVDAAAAPPDRPARAVRSAARSSRRAAGILAGMVAATALLYGGLVGLSAALQSDLDRLAALPKESVRTDGFSLRTRGPEAVASPDALYLESLALAEAAWREPLGLFPHYDAVALETAIRSLEATVEAAPVERARFVRHESLFLLARLRIAARDLDGARDALLQLIDEEADRAEAARRLLGELNRAAPA